MTDTEFRNAFETCTLPNGLFRHRDHIRLAWIYLASEEYAGAAVRMERSIRRFAAHHNAAHKYHHTITIAWMRLVALSRADDIGAGTFDAFALAHPFLMEKSTLFTFFSPRLLESAAARERWVEPDLCSLTSPDSPMTQSTPGM